MQNWYENLKIAINILNTGNIPFEKWVWGGGTALRWYYQHRDSKDIDIFFADPQLLGFITPRLNDKIESLVTDYVEGPTFVKLHFSDFEIDFIVCMNLTGLLPEWQHVGEYFIQIEKPEEIVAKKIFYKGLSLKIRDIIDIAIVYSDKPSLLEIITKRKLIPHPPEVIFKNLEKLKNRFNEKDLNEILMDKNFTAEAFLKCLNTVEAMFRQAIEKMSQRSANPLTET